MGFSSQECWSGLPFPPPGDPPNPGIKPASPSSFALSGRFFMTELPGKPLHLTTKDQKEKLRKQSHLSSHKKRIKYLGVNLPKEEKDLYPGNYKTLMKKIEEDRKKWNNILW